MQETMLLHRQQLAAEHQQVAHEAHVARSEMQELQAALLSQGQALAPTAQASPQFFGDASTQPIPAETEEDWCLSPGGTTQMNRWGQN